MNNFATMTDFFKSCIFLIKLNDEEDSIFLKVLTYILSTITHSHNGIGIYIPKRTFQKQVPISIFKVALEIE